MVSYRLQLNIELLNQNYGAFLISCLSIHWGTPPFSRDLPQARRFPAMDTSKRTQTGQTVSSNLNYFPHTTITIVIDIQNLCHERVQQ